ncbi:unnamed protein product [Paramecium pentaurelia]|uniref:Protein kinase domain-containing protein n=1 Tax=Paramecium pentaurelia TaxID=43138 RepID=A0A8S1WYF0_9CILI|nr:unnamed protein product [Paramecium pentaurelia]
MNPNIQNESVIVFIEGKMYQRNQIFSCQGIQSINYIGTLNGNPNEQIIIKQYNSITNDETEVLRQIKREQNEIQPRCQHIIKILGIQDQAQSKLLVMEKGNGNILELIESNKIHSIVQKIKIFEQMVKGVIELHNLGYFHRDLKPENFVYFENENKDYKIKLIDFGLVIKDFTIPDTWVVGTLNYMAPEIMVTGMEYDKTADIWSLGIILYELLTSKIFLQAKNQKELQQQIQNLSQEQIYNKLNQVDDIEKEDKQLLNMILQKDSKNRIKLETLLSKINEYYNSIKQQEEKKLLEIEEIRQSVIYQLETFKSTIMIFIQNLNYKLEKMNDLNTEYQVKQQLQSYIDDQLKKCNEKIIKIEQRLQQIQSSQPKEILKEHYSEIIQESQQQIQDSNLIMENIIKQSFLLEYQILKEKEEQLKIQQEQLLKKEQEEGLKKEQAQFKSLFQIVRQLSSSQITQIKKISQEINFYQRIQQSNYGEEKILHMTTQHQTLTQNIQGLKQQDKIISQFDSIIEKITIYQQFNILLEEIYQDQNRLKISIEEANKFIEETDRQYLDEHYQQIYELSDQLKDLFDKFKYQSQHQKYKDKINEIIYDITKDFGQLEFLAQLVDQKTLAGYQEYKTKYIQIQQFLSNYQKQQQQLHQQIYNDQYFEQINEERLKKLIITQDKFDQFKNQMNQLKDQLKNLINNQNNNNEQTKNLINNELIRFDQKIFELQRQFDNFNELNIQNQNPCEIISIQIKLLEEFQKKLKEVIDNEIEKIDQFKLIIEKKAAEQKSEQEKEILYLNHQLQNRYRIFQKVLLSINFQFENLEFYQNLSAKYNQLLEQLQQEIKILQEYLSVQHENQRLFEVNLKDNQTQGGQNKQIIENLLKRLQQINLQKGIRLENIFHSVSKKTTDLDFNLVDENLIKNYQQLKKREEDLSIIFNTINQKISNKQLNPEQLQELKKTILELCSELEQFMIQIPLNDEIQKFKKVYQQNVESYEILYALFNYIKQYHLTRYYERIKENANQQKKIQQNQNQNDYKTLFQSKLHVDLEENTKKEKESQDTLQRYENILFKSYNKMTIEAMEKDKEQIEKQIEFIENQIKQKDLVKLRASIKDQSDIKEIIHNRQYYKITEFSQMLIINIIRKEIKQKNQY